MSDATSRLSAQDLSVSFEKHAVLADLSLQIPDGKMTVIVGPNACGKSTLLRSLARLQPINAGSVVLDGKAIHKQSTKSVAKRLAILPQMPTAPEGMRVRDLVTRGRTPHQSPLRQWSSQDAELVARALEMTKLTQHAEKPLESLSGGQRQRAWIAMTLAQDTGIVLLDEPTTFLDLPHQIELLSLVRDLNRDTGRTVAMVLHDINLAARFADHMVAIKNRAVFCQGSPEEVVTQPHIQEIFGLDSVVISDPVHHKPHVIPS